MFDRRKLLAVSGAALIAGAAGCSPKAGEAPATPQAAGTGAPTSPPPPDTNVADDDTLRDFLAESLSEGDATGNAVGGLVTSFAELEAKPELLESTHDVMNKVAKRATVAVAVEDKDSVDYVSLVRQTELGADAAISTVAFKLTGEVLKSIATATGYWTVISKDPVVLFGLRGCVIDGASPKSGQTISVKEDTVNHVDRKCLIGMWKPATGDLSVFEGSTVPNLVNMQMHLFWQFAKTKGIGKVEELMCGQMPTGLHSYKVGTHLQSSKDITRRHPGALLQVSKSPVIRARQDLRYRWDEMWDPLLFRPPGVTSDRSVRVTNCNIHAGVNLAMPQFSSQGCQTVAGFYKPKGQTPMDEWAGLLGALGTEVVADGPAFKSNQDGKAFKYMLVTGREARLHANAAGKKDKLARLRRVRIGTEGATATALRKAIGYAAGTTVDGDVMNELLRWQGKVGVPLDGAVTPKLSEDLKMDVFKA